MAGDVEMSAAPYGTSSGIQDEKTTGIKNRKAKLGCGICCLIVGIVGIVLGAVLPPVINTLIDDGVYHASQLNPDTMSDSALVRFYDDPYTNEEFYLFNVTNLYDVLTNKAKINFQEIGPIRTVRHETRYNDQWDIPNGQVKYQWLTTFTVKPDNANVFWLAGAAQVMRTYLSTAAGQNVSDPKSFNPSANFPGRFLNEQVFVTGFIGSSVLPAFLPQFQNPAAAFLTSIRTAAVAFYTQSVAGTVAASSGLLSYSTALNAWATATPYLSAVPSLNGAYYRFELPIALQSASPSGVATAAFTASNQYGVASAAGVTAWVTYNTTTDATTKAQLAVALSTACSIDTTNTAVRDADLSVISGWVRSFATALPTSTDAATAAQGTAYQAVVCRTVASLIQNATTQSPAFAAAFSNVAGYTPSTWADIGALQFGTGLVYGFVASPATTIATGKGVSVAALPYLDFTAGVANYVSTNAVASTPAGWPAGSNQAPLWLANPALLYIGGSTSNAFINLQVNETTALFRTLLASSSGMGTLITVLKPVVQTYAGVFQQQVAAGSGVPAAIAAATTYANAQFDTYASILTPAGVTKRNFYAVWSYLYNYLGASLGGTLAQLDPASGLAPQNNGLFCKQTVREYLFGYQGKFAAIPAIAGAIRATTDAGFQAQKDADAASHVGREWVQDTGTGASPNTVGQWFKYEGSEGYLRTCDLDDPARTGKCSPAGSLAEASNNWLSFNTYNLIKGSGTYMQIQPFLENDNERPERLYFYVSELRRAIWVEYKKDVEVKGITLRRYGLWEALTNATYITPNAQKNEVDWRNGDVPDGFFSLQSYRGGYGGMASIPNWGLADPKVWQGCTCNGADCALAYKAELHETYVDLHPLTGLTMNGAKRLQANFRVRAQELWTGPSVAADSTAQPKNKWYPAEFPPGYTAIGGNTTTPGGFNYLYNNLFEHSESIIIPYYWGDINNVVQDDDASDARDAEKLIRVARRAREGLRFGGLIGGSLIFVASAAAIFHFYRAGKKV